MLNISSSDDVIAAMVAFWQIHISAETADQYRDTLQNLVKIARSEQMIGIAGDLNKVSEIQERSREA